MDEPADWATAQAWTRCLSVGGRGDWSLPTLAELQLLGWNQADTEAAEVLFEFEQTDRPAEGRRFERDSRVHAIGGVENAAEKNARREQDGDGCGEGGAVGLRVTGDEAAAADHRWPQEPYHLMGNCAEKRHP